MIGAAKAIGALEPEDVEVHFVVAACEVRLIRLVLIKTFHMILKDTRFHTEHG